MSSYVHNDNKKDLLVIGISSTQELDDTTLTGEDQYSINFSRSNRKFCLSLHYNGSNSFLFAKSTKKYQFKAKDSKIKKYLLCLGNISKRFSANNMKKNKNKTKLNRCVYDFSFSCKNFDLVILSISINI